MENNYMGRYERTARKLVAEKAKEININWINISEKEATNGGADKITNLLREAGYKPDGIGVIEEEREAYIEGTEKIRLPQETWMLQ